MDTLTHTLAGLVLGECAARALPQNRSTLSLEQRRGVYIALLCVGSNLPDSDFLYSVFTASKLDYLLHHRGHSHTVFGLLLAGFILFAAGWGWLRRARWPATRTDLSWLALWSLVGPVLHVSMDSTNTYGVHPLWPFSDRWWHGDSVFIIEPLFWAAAMPVVALLQRDWLRLSVTLVIAAVLALLFGSGLIPWPLRGLLVLALLGGLWLGHRCTARTALLTAVVAWCTVTGVFLSTHRHALRAVDDFVARTDPGTRTLDRILTPLPSNPLCWEVILVQLRAGQYTLRRATLALAPQWLAVSDCPNRDLETATSAPLRAVRAEQSERWQWFGEYVAEPKELAALAQRCESAAFLRFARAPWWSRSADGWQIGDLRYDRELEAGFAELQVHDTVRACPRHVPSWRPPRSELLQLDPRPEGS